MMRFVSLATKKLKWTDEYAIEKILPIACRTQLSVKIERQLCTTEGNKADARAEETEFVFEPVSLTKRRVASGISCFNVLWKKTKVHCGTENACPENMIPESYESCEPECLLVKSYPNLVEQFEQVESAKKKTKIRKPKVKKNVPNQTKAQKPITQFFVQAKESCRERKETLSENKGSTKNMCSKNDVNSRSLAVIDKNPLGNILQEKKIDGNTHNSNASHKAIVTPAVERTKRELLRKIFEESPDPRNCFALNEKYDSSKFKENKPLQSTPIQTIPKRVKDFTHKTPKMASSEVSDYPNLDTSTIENDSAFACEDLSFIIEDILSKRIEGHALPNLNRENDLQGEESSDSNKHELSVTRSDNSMKIKEKSSSPLNLQCNKNIPFLDDTLEDSFDRMCL